LTSIAYYANVNLSVCEFVDYVSRWWGGSSAATGEDQAKQQKAADNQENDSFQVSTSFVIFAVA
jgi:hypothetical protein